MSEISRCGGDVVAEFVAANTAPHVFGLPGSSSVSIFNGLGRVDAELVPSLQENAAVAMADGYSRFAGPTTVLLYMLPGVATALSNLYNAARDESQLLVVVSQLALSGRRGQAHVGEADLAPIVGPVATYAREVVAPNQLLDILGAGLRAASGPPGGPAFVVAPEDVLLASLPTTIDPVGARAPTMPVAVEVVVEQLAVAQRPLVVVGGQVRRCGGSAAVEALAEALCIPVMYEPFWNDRLGVSPAHSSVVGQLTEGSSFARDADVVLALGCRMFNEVHPRTDSWFPVDAFVAHVNADAAKLGEATTATWSSAADPGLFAEQLLEAVRSRGAPAQDLLAARRARIEDAQRRRSTPRPGPFNIVAEVLADELNHGYLVDESVSANFPLVAALRSERGDRYVSTTGGSLGWGIGAACGVALATGQSVTCVVGDGAFFFGCQALWPAVARALPVTFVVVDNGGFGSTQYFEDEFLRTHPHESERYAGSDFLGHGPSPLEVARGFGLHVEDVAAEDLAKRLHDLRGTGPSLLRVPVGKALEHEAAGGAR